MTYHINMIPEHCIEIFRKKFNYYPTIISINHEYIKTDLNNFFKKSIENWAHERIDAEGKKTVVERFLDYDSLGVMVYIKDRGDIFILTTGERKKVAEFMISRIKK